MRCPHVGLIDPMNQLWRNELGPAIRRFIRAVTGYSGSGMMRRVTSSGLSGMRRGDRGLISQDEVVAVAEIREAIGSDTVRIRPVGHFGSDSS